MLSRLARRERHRIRRLQQAGHTCGGTQQGHSQHVKAAASGAGCGMQALRSMLLNSWLSGHSPMHLGRFELQAPAGYLRQQPAGTQPAPDAQPHPGPQRTQVIVESSLQFPTFYVVLCCFIFYSGSLLSDHHQ